MKTFTLQEARTLLPVLRSLLERAIESKQTAEEAEEGMAELSRKIQMSGGMLVDIRRAALQRASYQKAVQQANEALEEIDSTGVQVKDLETGLLDFPFQLEQEIVLLCWKLGESDIGFWHSVSDGFRGRQTLDERFYPSGASQPQQSRDRDKPGGKPN
jgi:hypothetical protein